MLKRSVMGMRFTSAVLLTTIVAGCGGRTALEIPTPTRPVSAQQLAELWVDPGSRPRDLFRGIGGAQYAPRPEATYTIDSKDEVGFSVSFDVRDPDGREWSAKIGPEAQTEVVVSRLLWGLGYHQPPLHYLPSWLADERGAPPRRESEARFRPKLPNLKRLDEYWRWADNPFVGTREFRGLLVVLLMLNSTDLKDDNNSIYALDQPWDGARRWFVVRDLGAALGVTGKLFPQRNFLEGFEREKFIKGVRKDGSIDFHYDGRHQELLSLIRPADLRWAAARMQRLTDTQWRDAFRAANYPEWIADRFIRRIKQKIEEAAAVGGDRSTDTR
jgi:hypothetical protein